MAEWTSALAMQTGEDFAEAAAKVANAYGISVEDIDVVRLQETLNEATER